MELEARYEVYNIGEKRYFGDFSLGREVFYSLKGEPYYVNYLLKKKKKIAEIQYSYDRRAFSLILNGRYLIGVFKGGRISFDEISYRGYQKIKSKKKWVMRERVRDIKGIGTNFW